MKSVLIVDDVEANRYLLRSIFEAAGWEVLEANSGEEALEQAHQHPPLLVVSDIMMPGMDGYTLCRTWKHDPSLREIPFVFCTATFTNELDAQLAERLGADDFIRQPVDPDDLMEHIRILEERRARGESPSSFDPVGDERRLLEDYSAVLAQKLDHKVNEYRQANRELQTANAQLEQKSGELDRRVKQLTCLHMISSLALDCGVSFPKLCQEITKELSEAIGESRNAVIRLLFEGETYCSAGFEETSHYSEFASCTTCPDNRLQVYMKPTTPGGATEPSEDDVRLITTVMSQLCAEHQRHQHEAREHARAATSERLLTSANAAQGKSTDALLIEYLGSAIELTQSNSGHIHFVDDTGDTLRLAAIYPPDTAASPDTVQELSTTSAGIWADCLRRREPVVNNCFHSGTAGTELPGQSEPKQRHLGIPIMEDNRVRLILGVGDRKTPYSSIELNSLEIVGIALWHMLERRRREDDLSTANDRLRLLHTAMESASHTIVITDANGIIEYVNPAFTRASGYTAEEALGQNPRVLKSGRQPPGFYEDMWKTILAGKVWKGSFVNKRKDGTPFDEEAIITPVKNAAGEIAHFIAIKQDVTKQHEMEQRLLRSQRMESIGLLAGGVAHDLNNVLAPIMMAVEMLKGELPEAERRELLGMLESSCERGAGIIRQVLTFARGIDGERVVLQPRHLIKDLVKIGRETFPKDIQISLDMPADLWTVLGDPTQLHQVLLNLAVNARDAMPNGGQLKFSALNVTLTEDRTFLHATIAPGRYALIQVHDNGQGISPDVIERIFEPFFTSKPHGQGTGLGLPTVLGIVRSHKGLIEVTSKPRIGSTFSVYLPAGDITPDFASKPQSKPRRGNGETILLVDDEAAVRKVAGRILNLNGYQIVEAEDGAEAIARYAQNKADIALVVTDIVMPVMDGLALARALRSINPDIKIIGASGFAGDRGKSNRVAELKAMGVTTILEKPFSSDTLLCAIAEMISD